MVTTHLTRREGRLIRGPQLGDGRCRQLASISLDLLREWDFNGPCLEHDNNGYPTAIASACSDNSSERRRCDMAPAIAAGMLRWIIRSRGMPCLHVSRLSSQVGGGY